MAKCKFVYETGSLSGRQCVRQEVEGCDGFCEIHFKRLIKKNISKKAKGIAEKEKRRALVNAQDAKKEKERLADVRRARNREMVLKGREEARVQKAKEVLGTAVEKRISQQDTISFLKAGKINVDDLSWDELIGGFIYLRNEDGTIIDKREPIYFPREYYMRVTKALVTKADQLFRNEFDSAMKALSDLVTNRRTPARERYLAATYVIERVIGKIPEKREVDVHVTPFQELAESAQLIVDIDDPEILDAEIVEDG